MAGVVLRSIETSSNPLSSNSSVLSDDTYVEEERTPEPADREGRLEWGRKHYGENWYLEKVAGIEAAEKAQREEEERERIEDEKMEAIRKLQETDPWEYECRKREHNLRLQGVDKRQIDESNQLLSEEIIKSNWEGPAALLQGKALQLQKSRKEFSHKIRSGNRSNRLAPTLTGALTYGERTSDATNVKIPQSEHSKTRQQKAHIQKRASRRLANKPVEYGIFAEKSIATIPKDLQRNPSTRKRNPVGRSVVVEPAKNQGALKYGREGRYRLKSKPSRV